MKMASMFPWMLLVVTMGAPSARATDFELGRAAYARGDYTTAIAETYPLAMNGDPFAQYAMGVMTFQGNGTPVNYQQARAWFGAAARSGDPEAEYEFGEMLRQGLGGPQDTALAFMLFDHAASEGHEMAKYALAMMYAMGEGVPPNRQAASSVLREVAQSRDVQLASLAQRALVVVDPPMPPQGIQSAPTTQDRISSVKSFVEEHPFLTAMGALLVYSAMTNNSSDQSNGSAKGQRSTFSEEYSRWEAEQKEKREAELTRHNISCSAYDISKDQFAKSLEGCP